MLDSDVSFHFALLTPVGINSGLSSFLGSTQEGNSSGVGFEHFSISTSSNLAVAMNWSLTKLL